MLTCVVADIPQALDWNLCPETPISWLKLYAQVDAQKDGENFLEPQFSQKMYIQITQVPSRCSLNSALFGYVIGIFKWTFCPVPFSF